jgi:hypothetical protein
LGVKLVFSLEDDVAGLFSARLVLDTGVGVRVGVRVGVAVGPAVVGVSVGVGVGVVP